MDFLWGAATSAHQVEGDNDNDWADWERTPGSGVAEPAGRACDHVRRYPQDIALLADLGSPGAAFVPPRARSASPR